MANPAQNHLLPLPKLVVANFALYSELSTQKLGMSILASDIPTTFCRKLTRAIRRIVTNFANYHPDIDDFNDISDK